MLQAFRRVLQSAAFTGCVMAAMPAQAGPLINFLDGVKQGLDLATYRVHTIFQKPDGTVIERNVPAIILVGPLVLPVDVDGDRIPDVMTEVRPALPPNLVSVSFLRIAPPFLRELPVLVEVQIDVPGGTGATLGVDARQGNLPERTGVRARLALAQLSSNRIDASVTATASGGRGPMGYIASTFTRGANGARLNPTAAAVTLNPLPQQLTLEAQLDNGAQPSGTFSLEVSEAVVATAAVSTVQGSRSQAIDARVDQLPARVSVSFADLGAGKSTVDYVASTPIDRIDAKLVTRESGSIRSHVVANVLGLASSVAVDIDPPRITATASEPIGSIEAGFSNTAQSPLATGIAEPGYAVLDTLTRFKGGVELGRDISAAVRVPGLSSVEFDGGSPDSGRPMSMQLDFGGGAFRARAQERASTVLPSPTQPTPDGLQQSIDALADALPGSIGLEIDARTGRFSYDANAPLALLEAKIFTRSGLGDIGSFFIVPNRLDVTIRDIPGTIDVVLGAPRGRKRVMLPEGPEPEDAEKHILEFRAGPLNALGRVLGNGIGSIEALLSFDGLPPSNPLGVNQTGVVFEDSFTRLAIQARINGLKQISVFEGGPAVSKPNFESSAHPQQRIFVDVGGSNSAFLARLDFGGGIIGLPARFLTAKLTGIPSGVQVRTREIAGPARCEVLGIPQPFPEEQCEALGGTVVPGSPRGNQFSYRADQPIERVELETDFGGPPFPLVARLSDVPTSIDLCVSDDNFCMRQIDRIVPAREFSAALVANQPVTLDLMMCKETADASTAAGTCRLNNASAMRKGLHLSNLSFQKVFADFKFASAPRRVGIDTEQTLVTGQILNIADIRIKLTMRPEFSNEGQVSVTGIGGAFNPSLLINNLSTDDGALIMDNLRIGQDGLNVFVDGGMVCRSNTAPSLRIDFAGSRRDLLEDEMRALICS